jgi:hypothetical protein
VDRRELKAVIAKSLRFMGATVKAEPAPLDAELSTVTSHT